MFAFKERLLFSKTCSQKIHLLCKEFDSSETFIFRGKCDILKRTSIAREIFVMKGRVFKRCLSDIIKSYLSSYDLMTLPWTTTPHSWIIFICQHYDERYKNQLLTSNFIIKFTIIKRINLDSISHSPKIVLNT